MKWYKHMSNMRHDPKVKRLKKKYGAEGYSIYVEIVTAISENLDPINNILPFLEEDINEIADEFDIAHHKAAEIVNFCVDQGLLEKSTNDYIFCFKLYKFVDEYFTKKQANTMHVADRNKAVITAYKDGGLPLALSVLQTYIADLMGIIGEIEIKSTNKRSNLALLSPNSGVTTDQRRPDKRRLDEIKEDDIILDKNRENKKANFGNDKPFNPNDYMKFKPENTDKPKQKLAALRNCWNSIMTQENHPLDLNISIDNIRLNFIQTTKFEYYETCVKHYSEAYEFNKFKIGGFVASLNPDFTARWLSPQSVVRLKEQSEFGKFKKDNDDGGVEYVGK